MPKIVIRTLEEYTATGRAISPESSAEIFTCFDGHYHGLQLDLHSLSVGAVEHMKPAHTDRALFVWQGIIETCGHALEAGSSIVVESGAALEIDCLEGPTELLVFAAAPGIDVVRGRNRASVRILPVQNVPRYGDPLGGSCVGGALHADSTWPGCSIWLHENMVPAPTVGADAEDLMVHSHSVDEIIFVTGGELWFGQRCVRPGGALAIAANAFYSFKPGADGLSFVNFRGERPAELRLKNGGAIDEPEYWRTQVGSPESIVIDTLQVQAAAQRAACAPTLR